MTFRLESYDSWQIGKVDIVRLDHVPTEDEIDEIVELPVDGLSIFSATYSDRRMVRLDWIARFVKPLRYVDILIPGRQANEFPSTVLASVEHLSFGGRLKAPVGLSSLSNATSISMPENCYLGRPRDLPGVRFFCVDRASITSLSYFDYCENLELASVTLSAAARGSLWDFHSNSVFPKLTRLYVDRARVLSFDGVSALPQLATLFLQPDDPIIPPPEIDVTPLLGCPELRDVGAHFNGIFTHLDNLAYLLKLEKFALYRKFVSLMHSIPDKPWVYIG